jgi:dienelactone hydrolase
MPTKTVLLFSFIIFVIGSTASVRADAEELPKGRVIEKVQVLSDPTQHYALYLPAAYTRARRYPVLYCFDPGGRGALPVSRFKDAAEKYGYIVVGSNNSRNGPDVDVNDIFRKLWDDTHALFSIDERRVYLTGFSGGARLALSAAYALKSSVAGVISCSGGFPTRQKSLPPLTFALFGTSGVSDFNNPEMRELFRAIESSAAPNRLAFFVGGHEWPPDELCDEAIEWMELQAMRGGLREKNQAFVEELFERGEAEARAAEEANDLYRAYLVYARLAKDFAGLLDVTEAETKAARLKTTKEAAQGLKRDADMEDEQRRRERKLSTLVDTLRSAQERSAAMSALKRAIGELKKALSSKPDGDEAILAKRLFDMLLVQSFEQGSASLFEKDYEGAAATFALGAELQPDDPRIFYQLARAYALAKEKAKALAALRVAADKGFDDAAAINAAEFAPLRDDKRFKDIAEAVAKNHAAKGAH